MMHTSHNPIEAEKAQMMKQQFLKAYPALSAWTVNGNWVSWPADVPRRRLMGSNFPCDMWTGPCSCGAVHEEGR